MRKESIIDKKWVISQNHWQLLLSQYGKNLKYGIYFFTERQDKRQVIENLYEMVNKGILLTDGKKLTVDQEYRRLLEFTSKAKKGCFLEDKERIGNFFLYLGEECVICETSPTRKNCFIFSIKKKEEILSYLFEIGFFPRYCMESEESEWLQTFFKDEKEKWEVSQECMEEKRVTFFDLEKGEEFATLFISLEEGEEYLIWGDNDSMQKVLLSEENLKKVWKELVDNAVCGSESACIGTSL